jgi:hypothetical protein
MLLWFPCSKRYVEAVGLRVVIFERLFPAYHAAQAEHLSVTGNIQKLDM